MERKTIYPSLMLALLLAAAPACAQPSVPVRFDLSLGEAFERAQQFNPQLLAAGHNLNLGQADITSAGVVPNPVLGVQYGFGNIFRRNLVISSMPRFSRNCLQAARPAKTL